MYSVHQHHESILKARGVSVDHLTSLAACFFIGFFQAEA